MKQLLSIFNKIQESDSYKSFRKKITSCNKDNAPTCIKPLMSKGFEDRFSGTIIKSPSMCSKTKNCIDWVKVVEFAKNCPLDNKLRYTKDCLQPVDNNVNIIIGGLMYLRGVRPIPKQKDGPLYTCKLHYDIKKNNWDFDIIAQIEQDECGRRGGQGAPLWSGD